jgi:NAD(P)-dependent dehydrogenase (short-subunit alcohol dehydrogenase family)
MADWNGQVAVITGAASGIGAGLARHASALGMQVVATDVDRDGLSALSGLAGIETWLVDVASSEDVEALAAEIFDIHGRVNLLFNNAGVLVDGKSWERSAKDWQWCLDVNIMGVVNGIRSFVPRMLAQGEAGRVINTSSIGGLLGGSAFLGPYQGSKHAITAISETLHAELALEDAPITASVLCPGEVVSGIWESGRLRPTEDRYKLGSEAENAFHDTVAGMVADGLSPEEFARRAFAGIAADQFWILPQTEFKPLFQQRVDAILGQD